MVSAKRGNPPLDCHLNKTAVVRDGSMHEADNAYSIQST